MNKFKLPRKKKKQFVKDMLTLRSITLKPGSNASKNEIKKELLRWFNNFRYNQNIKKIY